MRARRANRAAVEAAAKPSDQSQGKPEGRRYRRTMPRKHKADKAREARRVKPAAVVVMGVCPQGLFEQRIVKK